MKTEIRCPIKRPHMRNLPESKVYEQEECGRLLGYIKSEDAEVGFLCPDCCQFIKAVAKDDIIEVTVIPKGDRITMSTVKAVCYAN